MPVDNNSRVIDSQDNMTATRRTTPINSVFVVLGVFLAVSVTGCEKTRPLPQPIARRGDQRWNLDDRIRKYQEHVDVAQVTADMIGTGYEPNPPFQFDVPDASVRDAISALPGVISATVSDTDHATSRVIHLLSLVVPSKPDFMIVLRQMADGGVSQNQLDSLYDDYLRQIKLMQIEQMIIVRCLARHHGLRRIYFEGPAQRDFVLSRGASEPNGDVDDGEYAAKRNLDITGTEPWTDALPRNYFDESEKWQMEGILPIDSETGIAVPVYRKTNSNWKVVQPRNIQTIDREVEMAIADDGYCLIVGDANDFSESVKRVAGGKCQYIRVETKWWRAASPLDPNVWGRQ